MRTPTQPLVTQRSNTLLGKATKVKPEGAFERPFLRITCLGKASTGAHASATRYKRSPGPAWHANLLPDLDRVRVVYVVESRELLHRQVISRRDLREGLAASDTVPYRGDVERGRLHL